MAQIGAVIGRGFPYALIRAVAGIEDTALQTELERLAEADILLVQGLPPDSYYRFKHALIQDAAYSTMLRTRGAVGGKNPTSGMSSTLASSSFEP